MRQAEIETLLPGVLRRGILPNTPLDALLGVMEELHAPVEDVLGRLDDTFQPYRCPDRFVPFLARWVDLDRFLDDDDGATGLPTGVGRLRDLVAAAARLSKWRGTTRGFVEFLETATGVTGFIVEEQVRDDAGDVRPFVIRLRVPPAATPYLELIRRIVNAEKPAYIVCEIVLPPPSGAADASLPAPTTPVPSEEPADA